MKTLPLITKPLHSHLIDISSLGFTSLFLKFSPPSMKFPLAQQSTCISKSFWTAENINHTFISKIVVFEVFEF